MNHGLLAACYFIYFMDISILHIMKILLRKYYKVNELWSFCVEVFIFLRLYFIFTQVFVIIASSKVLVFH